MLPTSIAVATSCQLSGIGGAALFSPIFLLAFPLLGPDYPQHNLTLNSLGQLYQKMERLDDAERYLRDAVEHARRVRGAASCAFEDRARRDEKSLW